MPPFIRFVLPLVVAALSTACAPVRLVPTSLAGEPQGATFFAEPAQKLPTWPDAPVLAPRRLPSLNGDAACGGDFGEQTRAQCLRGLGVEGALGVE